MFSDETLYWFMIVPIGFFLFCLVSFLYALRHEKPRQSDNAQEPIQLDCNELPGDLHRALDEISAKGGHVEVTRLNGKVAVTFELPQPENVGLNDTAMTSTDSRSS